MLPTDGLLSQTMARMLADVRRQVESNRRTLAEMAITSRDRFPAKLTAYDYTTGRYSWTEQAFDADGERYDKPGGRSGTSTFAPAYAFGNGDFLTTFPHEVMLRRRLIAGTLGPVYEFQNICACETGDGLSGSGSGDDGGVVLTSCCPNPIPRTLYGTFSATGCACLDGMEVRFVYDGISHWRPDQDSEDSLAACGFPRALAIRCTEFGWRLSEGPVQSGCGLMGSSPEGGESAAIGVNCSPFQLTFGLLYISESGEGTCPCKDILWGLTVTE